jgi:hypothetical protein
MRRYPVTTRINHMANCDEECLKPVQVAEVQTLRPYLITIVCISEHSEAFGASLPVGIKAQNGRFEY